MKLDDSKRAPLDPLSGTHLAGRPAQRLLKADQSKAPEDSEVKPAQLLVESLDPRDRFLKRHKRSFKGLLQRASKCFGLELSLKAVP